MKDQQLDGFAVRCVFEWDNAEEVHYEERITLWQAPGIDEAMRLAQAEAFAYANEFADIEALAFTQGYHLPDPPGHGVEIFSLLRASHLDPDLYLDRFFATGDEIERLSWPFISLNLGLVVTSPIRRNRLPYNWTLTTGVSSHEAEIGPY